MKISGTQSIFDSTPPPSIALSVEHILFSLTEQLAESGKKLMKKEAETADLAVRLKEMEALTQDLQAQLSSMTDEVQMAKTGAGRAMAAASACAKEARLRGTKFEDLNKKNTNDFTREKNVTAERHEELIEGLELLNREANKHLVEQYKRLDDQLQRIRHLEEAKANEVTKTRTAKIATLEITTQPVAKRTKTNSATKPPSYPTSNGPARNHRPQQGGINQNWGNRTHSGGHTNNGPVHPNSSGRTSQQPATAHKVRKALTKIPGLQGDVLQKHVSMLLNDILAKRVKINAFRTAIGDDTDHECNTVQRALDTVSKELNLWDYTPRS